jgi:hypothetical protein
MSRVTILRGEKKREREGGEEEGREAEREVKHDKIEVGNKNQSPVYTMVYTPCTSEY